MTSYKFDYITEGSPDYGECMVERNGGNKVNISCKCEGSGYYQAILQEESVDDIQAYRSQCLDTITFEVKIGHYGVTVFYDNGMNSILNGSVYYAKQFSIDNTTDVSTTMSILRSSAPITG